MRVARFQTTRLLTILAAATLICGGCGTTSVADIGESQLLDVSPKDTGGTDTGVTPDSADTAQGDGAGGDVAGDECLTKYDCKNQKGETPCTVPACDNGYCKLEARPVGSECIDTTTVISVCEEFKCNAKTECEAVSRPDGAGCTDANIALDECQIGACTAGKCGASNKEDGNVCGIGACKECKQGKCAATTAADVDDGNPCTTDFCDPNNGEVHEKLTDLTAPCDDGKTCTGDGHCVNGSCDAKPLDCNDGVGCTVDLCDEATGCTHTSADKDCPAIGPCANVACDISAGCTITSFNSGATCDDGDSECTKDDACTATGDCVGTPTCGCTKDSDCLDKSGNQKDLCRPQFCKTDGSSGFCVVDLALQVTCVNNGGACADNVCDADSGECKLFAKNEDKACDDGNKCTDKSACKQGDCIGEADPTQCDDKNPCTLDSCSPDSGCAHAPGGGECDDGSLCTLDDSCVNGGCTGEAKGCDDGIVCTKDTCNAESGACENTADAVQCNDNNPCTKDVCDTDAGSETKGCSNKPDDDAVCEDDSECTINVCKSGQCVVKSYDKTKPGCGCTKDAECNDSNPCTDDKCAAGDCTFDPKGKEGATCETGNVCHTTASGLCAAGACTGGKPKDCSAAGDKCHTAQCNQNTGQCEPVQKPDKTACDADDSKCTVDDACAKGVCTVGKVKDCSESGDACNDAMCTAATGECGKKPKKSGFECEDSNICTDTDLCDGKGKCIPGTAKDCSGSADTCNTGACDQAEGCVKVSKGVIACNDGQFCTQTDKCAETTVNKRKVGECVGTGVPDCTADATKCEVAFCDPNANKCAIKPAALGAGCSDGNACTLIDKCDAAGTCHGTSPKQCDGDQCNDPTCTAANGACGLKPKANGLKCNDADLCTQVDTCQTGKCKGANPKVCAGDACNTGKCVSSNGSCTLVPKSNTTACDDGQKCTTYDLCNNGTCKPGKWTCGCKVTADCEDKNECTADACVKATDGTLSCKNTPKTGVACDDGSKCTLTDKCDAAGACKGTAKVCDDKNDCTLDSCDSSSGSCAYNTISGAKCSDGNNCTESDTCVGNKCVGKATTCSDGNACTNDACNASTGKCDFVANTAACSDGNNCTLGDKCSNKVCAGTPKVCDDGTKCTTNSCSAKTGACSFPAYTPYNNQVCENGSYSRCWNGKCNCTNWQVEVGSTSTDYYEQLYDIKRDGDDWVAVGYRRYRNPTTSKYYYYGYIVKTDQWGTVIWERTANYVTTENTHRLHGLVRDVAHKRWIAVGYVYYNATYSNDAWIVEYDDNGNRTRNYVFRDTASKQKGLKSDILYDVAVDAAGYVYAVGYSYNYGAGSRYNAWMVKLQEYSSYYKPLWYSAKVSDTYSSQYKGVAWNSSYSKMVAVGYTSTASNGNDALVATYTTNSLTGTSVSYDTFGNNRSQILEDVSCYSSRYIAVGYYDSYVAGATVQNGYQGYRIIGNGSTGNKYYESQYGNTGTDLFYGIDCSSGYCYTVGTWYDATAKKTKLWLQRSPYSSNSVYNDNHIDLGTVFPGVAKVAYRSTSALGVAGYRNSNGWIGQVSYNGMQTCTGKKIIIAK